MDRRKGKGKPKKKEERNTAYLKVSAWKFKREFRGGKLGDCTRKSVDKENRKGCAGAVKHRREGDVAERIAIN